MYQTCKYLSKLSPAKRSLWMSNRAIPLKTSRQKFKIKREFRRINSGSTKWALSALKAQASLVYDKATPLEAGTSLEPNLPPVFGNIYMGPVLMPLLG